MIFNFLSVLAQDRLPPAISYKKQQLGFKDLDLSPRGVGLGAEQLGKKMKLNWKLWLPQKHRHLLVKFAVIILLMGFAFRLVFVRSTGISSRIETTFPDDSSRTQTPFPKEAGESKPLVSEEAPQTGDQLSVRGNSISKL